MSPLFSIAAALCGAAFAADPPPPPIDLDVCCVARSQSSRSRPQFLLRLHGKRAAAGKASFRSVRTAAGLGEPGCDVFVVAGAAKGTGLLSAEAVSGKSHSLLLRYEASPGMKSADGFDRLWDLLAEVLQKGEPGYQTVRSEIPARAEAAPAPAPAPAPKAEPAPAPAPAEPPAEKPQKGKRLTPKQLKDIDSQL